MFLKEKRDGTIKGRGCADGRKQQLWFSKGETLAPTAMMESVFLTSVINAKEKQEIATVEIPGAFLKAQSKTYPIIQLD